MRLPFTIIGVLLCILIPLGLLGGKHTHGRAQTTPVALIAQRVEAIRHLRYRKIPKPVVVTPAQAQKEGLQEFDHDDPIAQRQGDEALYTLLGLLPPGADLRKINSTILGEQVAGYYDPEDGRLRIVKQAATGDRVINEITIAHELTHALEDQAIGLKLSLDNQTDDGGYAYRALVEGTATAVMFTYLERYFKREDALGGIFGSAFAGGSTAGIPPFELAGLLFPYTAGRAFVENLYARANGTWALVDLAETKRPPVSTEQILHPEKWLDDERPDPVTLPAPPPGYARITRGTFGEFQTQQLLAQAGDGAVAAGWGGDAYAVYRRGTGPCATPCRSRDLLMMRWTWDTPAAQRAFLAALPDLVGVLHGNAAFGHDATSVTLALAPTAGLARLVADAPG